MDYFLTLFDQYTTGVRGGVVVFGAGNNAVCMWGDVLAEGGFDHAEGCVAHGLGTYVRKEFRSKNVTGLLWRRASKILKKRGFDAVIAAVDIQPEESKIEGHRGFDRAVSFGFIPTEIVGVLRL